MLMMVTGGSASGKSEYAEQIAVRLDAGERIYLATMRSFDAECEARIAKHRAARAGRGFVTVERYTGLAEEKIPAGAVVLLECLSNIVANELFDETGAGENAVQAVLSGIDSLCRQAAHLIVVTNEVFSDGEGYDPVTLHYIDLLGEINRKLAARADRVVEVVYSIPVVLKGEETR